MELSTRKDLTTGFTGHSHRAICLKLWFQSLNVESGLAQSTTNAVADVQSGKQRRSANTVRVLGAKSTKLETSEASVLHRNISPDAVAWLYVLY